MVKGKLGHVLLTDNEYNKLKCKADNCTTSTTTNSTSTQSVASSYNIPNSVRLQGSFSDVYGLFDTLISDIKTDTNNIDTNGIGVYLNNTGTGVFHGQHITTINTVDALGNPRTGLVIDSNLNAIAGGNGFARITIVVNHYVNKELQIFDRYEFYYNANANLNGHELKKNGVTVTDATAAAEGWFLGSSAAGYTFIPIVDTFTDSTSGMENDVIVTFQMT